MVKKAHQKQQVAKHKPTSARNRSLAPADPDDKPSMTMAEQEEQAELAGIKEGAVAELPKQVQNGMILATMLKPDFEEGKDDKRFIGVALSFQLTTEHEDMLPDQVADAWDFVKKGGTKRIDIVDITPQSLEVGFAPDTKVEIEIPWTDIRKASISVVEESGKGETQEVIRFKFVAFSEIEASVVRFCSKYFGKAVWIKLEKSQAEIPGADEE